jgi:hypothetical protein
LSTRTEYKLNRSETNYTCTYFSCITVWTDRCWDPPSLLFSGYRGTFTGVKRPGREANHCPLLPRFRMVALYTFMLWTGKTLPVFCGLQGMASVKGHNDTVGSTAVPFKDGHFLSLGFAGVERLHVCVLWSGSHVCDESCVDIRSD